MNPWAPINPLQGVRYSICLLLLTEEGRPGGTFLIFFGWGSEEERQSEIQISVHSLTKILTSCRRDTTTTNEGTD